MTYKEGMSPGIMDTISEIGKQTKESEQGKETKEKTIEERSIHQGKKILKEEFQQFYVDRIKDRTRQETTFADYKKERKGEIEDFLFGDPNVSESEAKDSAPRALWESYAGAYADFLGKRYVPIFQAFHSYKQHDKRNEDKSLGDFREFIKGKTDKAYADAESKYSPDEVDEKIAEKAKTDNVLKTQLRWLALLSPTESQKDMMRSEFSTKRGISFELMKGMKAEDDEERNNATAKTKNWLLSNTSWRSKLELEHAPGRMSESLEIEGVVKGLVGKFMDDINTQVSHPSEAE
ncbi:hypothetical protein ACFL2B_03020 [Patescibacteria group bacterium]